MNQDNLQTDLSVTAEIKLYYDIRIPENAAGPAPLMIAVHGYGAHKRYMMREARQIAPDNFVIVSIQAPNSHFRKTDKGFRVGFGWLTDFKAEESIALHQKFIIDIIERLRGEGLIDEKRIFLYGFSQACALNFKFAFTNPELLCGVLGVCGGIPGDFETNEAYHPTSADVLYLYSRRDEFYPLEKFQEFDKKLDKYLKRYESKSYDAEHEINEEMRADIRLWLDKFV